MHLRDRRKQCVSCGEINAEFVCLPNSGVPLCIDCWVEMETEAQYGPVPSPPNPNGYRGTDGATLYHGFEPCSVESLIDAMDSLN